MTTKGRALVTGGAGCIGSDLAEGLLADGQEVIVLDNLSSGKLEHIEALRDHPKFEFLQGDMLEESSLSEALEGVEIVYHLAANPDIKFQVGDPTDRDLWQNTVATQRLLDAMSRRNVKKIAFASSSAVYGIQEQLPISETAVCRPISLYGASKLACEAVIGAFAHLFEMQCWLFRFANIVNVKTRKRGGTVIGDFIEKLRQNPRELLILGNGKQAKSYLHSHDCVNAMRFVVEHAREPINLYNLGSSDWMTVTAIADAVVAAMGLSDVTYRYTGTEGGWPGDVPRFLLDVRKLADLGWKAKDSSAEAITETISSLLSCARVS